MADDLSGTVALVTGGARGIGLNVARELGEAGARVAISARSGDRLERAARELGAVTVRGDVSVEADVARMVAETEAGYGPIDLLVANAGIAAAARAPRGVARGWWHVFEVNVLGTYLCCRAVLPAMLERGARPDRACSAAAPRTCLSAPARGRQYGASKAAVGRFGEYLAAEVGPRGIAVFVISPGLVQTDMTEAFGATCRGRRPRRAAARPGARLRARRPPRRPVPPRRARRHRAADRTCRRDRRERPERDPPAPVKSRAAVFHAPGQPFEIAELDLDEPREDEVVVRMAAVGICGTDLHQVKGEFTRPTPMVLGHEGSASSSGPARGSRRCAGATRSSLSWAPGCGTCVGCRRGRPATCRPLNAAIGAGTLPNGRTGLSLRGETVYRGTVTGCFADRVVVGERAALAVRGVPLEEAALLGCAALTGVGASALRRGRSARLERARGRRRRRRAVRRAGGAARRRVDHHRLRRVRRAARRARALGARAVAPEELEEASRRQAPDGSTTRSTPWGCPAPVATAVRHLRDGGTAVVVGLPPAGQRFELEPFELIRREKRVTGTSTARSTRQWHCPCCSSTCRRAGSSSPRSSATATRSSRSTHRRRQPGGQRQPRPRHVP